MVAAMTFTFLHQRLGNQLPESHRGAVVAIGNFDGIHLGHQAVLGKAVEIAAAEKRPVIALTFEPHPRTLFKPGSPVFRLTPEPDKARVLQAFGLDGVTVLDFTRETAATSASDFVSAILLDALGAHHVVTGFNFHFGKGREGSPEFLREAGQRLGFGVTTVEALNAGEEPVSSSRIRRLLGEGEVVKAAGLLDYRWQLSGPVEKGAQLGRSLGFPTANIVPPAECRLAHGVYAVRLRRADGSLHGGVASFGRRPTFDNGPAWFETFVFDFNDDLYGEAITVSLFERLRGEEKYDSVDALVEQMKRDEAAARQVLRKAQPLSPLDHKLTFDTGKADA